MLDNLEIIGCVYFIQYIAKIELQTIKVEIADFPFFSHQLIVDWQSRVSCCSTFLFAQIRLYQNFYFKLESKTVFKIQIQGLHKKVKYLPKMKVLPKIELEFKIRNQNSKTGFGQIEIQNMGLTLRNIF